MRVTERDVAFFVEALSRSECAATKLRYLQRVQGAQYTPSDPLCLRTTTHATWSLDKALVAARVVALDARTMWECMGPRLLCTLRAPHDRWNEQLAVKVLLRFLAQRRRHDDDDDDGDGGVSTPLTRDTLATHAAMYIKPRHTADHEDTNKSSNSNGLCSSSNSDNDDGATCGGCDAVTVAAAPWATPHTLTTDECALLCKRPQRAFAPLLRIPREALLCTATLRRYCAFAHALSRLSCGVDEEALLVLCLVYERFVVGTAASHWRTLLTHCPDSYPRLPLFWPAHALAELEGTDIVDEVVRKREQVEQFCEAVRELLVQQLSSPSSSAHGEAATVEQQHNGVTVAANAACMCSDDDDMAAMRTVVQRLLHVLTPASVLWAHATVDSRAFQLRVDGRDALVLVPVADMLNHSNYTDVLTRRVLPMSSRSSRNGDGGDSNDGDEDADDEDADDEDDDGAFVAHIGAALTPTDVGRELWMCYGPLQNWELLLYYGFVLDANEHDKLPFPLDVCSNTTTATNASDDGNDDAYSATADDEQATHAQRRALVAQYDLMLPGHCWIAYDGVPCDALLALLRVHVASAEEVAAMAAKGVAPCTGQTTPAAACEAAASWGPYTPQSATTEAAVLHALSSTVHAVLSLFSTTLDDDVAALPVAAAHDAACDDAGATVTQAAGTVTNKHNNNNNSTDGSNDDDNNDDEVSDVDEAQHRANVVLAMRLRIALKQMAHRTLAWCERRCAAVALPQPATVA